MSNQYVDHARAFMAMLRDFRQPNPDGDHYEGMLECDVRDLAQGAALLIEATAKSMPQWLFLGENDPEQLKVRISNLEAQNEGLRVNNDALRKANALLGAVADKLTNPAQVLTHNSGVGGEPSR